MENKILIPILTIALPLIGAVVGYFIKHSIEKKKELLTEVTKERREHYQKFIDLIMDVFMNAKTEDHLESKIVIQKLYDFNKKYILYASPKVIKATSNYFQYLYSKSGETDQLDPRIHIEKLSKIIIEMRTDIGLSNKSLGKNGKKLLRSLITDFDKIMIGKS
jgi:hypothetical protein